MSGEVREWEYHALAGTILDESGPDAAVVWERRGEDGKTTFDRILGLGEQGWELVSVCPIERQSYTVQLLFVFKRPKLVEVGEVVEESPAEEVPQEPELVSGDSGSSVAENEVPETL